MGPEIRAADGRGGFAISSSEWNSVAPGRTLLAVTYERMTSLHGSYWIDGFQLATGRKTTILQPQPRLIGTAAWVGGNRLMFALATQDNPAGPFSSNNFWVISVDPDSGHPVGPPVRRTHWADFNMTGASATPDGSRVCFLRVKRQLTVWTAAVEKGGAALSDLRRLTSEDSVDSPMAWMPDGKAVLFTSDRSGVRQVYRQDLGQETAQMLTSGAETGPEVRVSPDGKWLLYTVPDASGSGTWVMRLPIAGGNPERVFRSDGRPDLQCSRAPGGACAVLERGETKALVSVFDPLRGRGPRIMEIGALNNFAGPSPDGRHIAIVPHDSPHNRIQVFDFRGVLEREITVQGAQTLSGCDWTADGSGFFAGDLHGNEMRLLHIDKTGAYEVLMTQRSQRPVHATPGSIHAIPSPDGRYIATMKEKVESNVWMVENP
jgi:Tol biopolymer transport system component